MGLQEIKQYFEGQGALANFLQISLGALTVLGFTWKAYQYIKRLVSEPRYLSLQSYVEALPKQGKPATSLRILILDDELADYPANELRHIGYPVTEKTSLSLSEIDSIKSFDVILLDIRGVLKEDLKSGGLEILKRLKKDNKRPYVVAVSSKGFDPTLAEFFMLANERLKKPIQAATIESTIKKAYEDEFSPLYAAKRIDECLGAANPNNSTAKKNLKHTIDYLNGRMAEDRLQMQLEKSLGREAVTRIFTDLHIIRTEAK